MTKDPFLHHDVYNKSEIRAFPFTNLVFATGNDAHCHTFWEICYVLKGNSTNNMRAQSTQLYPGSALIFRPKDTHFISIDTRNEYIHRDIYIEDEKMKRVCALIAPDLYDSLSSPETPEFFHISSSHIESLEINLNLIDSAPKTYDSEGFVKYKEQEMLDELHSAIVSQFMSYYIASHFTQNTKRPLWLTELVHKLTSTQFLLLPIHEIIEMTHYSHGHVCREFKRYFGISLSQYVQKSKITLASMMLMQSNNSISNIAYQLGFSSQSNFIKCFKKFYTVSPNQWRKQKTSNGRNPKFKAL